MTIFTFICIIYVSLYRPNWIKIYGEQYHRNEFLLVGFQQEDDLPFFGKIYDLVVASNIPLIAVELYKTEGINSHIAAYLIKRMNKKSCFLLASLSYKNPLYAHSYNGNLYIVFKTHTPDLKNEQIIIFVSIHIKFDRQLITSVCCH